ARLLRSTSPRLPLNRNRAVSGRLRRVGFRSRRLMLVSVPAVLFLRHRPKPPASLPTPTERTQAHREALTCDKHSLSTRRALSHTPILRPRWGRRLSSRCSPPAAAATAAAAGSAVAAPGAAPTEATTGPTPPRT